MLKILGRANSVNVQKVLLTCAEFNIEFERDDVGGPFGGNKEPAYLAMNPNGLVPVLIDGDLVLWESNSIVRYLGARYTNDSFCPSDPGRRALCDRWMDWQLSVLAPPHNPLFIGLIRTAPENRDMELIKRSRDNFSAAVKVLDGALAGRPWLAGDHFTMADVPAGAMVHRWFEMPIEREDHANARAWYDRLLDRPAYRSVCAHPLT